MGTKAPFKSVWGFISVPALIILLAVIVAAGLIFYRLIAADRAVQLALDDSTAIVEEPIRYKISPHPSPVADNGIMAQDREGAPPVSAESEMAPEIGAPKPIDDTLLPTAEVKEDGGSPASDPPPDIQEDSQTTQLESTISGDPTTPAQSMRSVKGPEALYVKVPAGRVRKAPSMDAEIILYLKKGDKVSVIDTRDGWYFLDTMDGQRGWAHGMLFSLDAPRIQVQEGVDKNLIQAVLVETPTPNRRAVHIVLSDYHLPRTMVLEGDRPRVVCDFYGLRLSQGVKKVTEFETGLVRGVRMGIHPGDNPKVRIVIDLVPEHDYIIEQKFILEENVYLLDIRLK